MASLTGKPVNVKYSLGKYEEGDLNNYVLFNKIKSALMKGKFIACSGGASGMRIKDNLTGKSVNLLGKHAYSVVNASESGSERVITLINPHRGQDDPKSGIIGSDEFTMAYDDFQKFFIKVYISSNKKIVR